MSLNNEPISIHDISNQIAGFKKKVIDIVSLTMVNQDVCNGSRKIYAMNLFIS